MNPTCSVGPLRTGRCHWWIPVGRSHSGCFASGLRPELRGNNETDGRRGAIFHQQRLKISQRGTSYLACDPTFPADLVIIQVITVPLWPLWGWGVFSDFGFLNLQPKALSGRRSMSRCPHGALGLLTFRSWWTRKQDRLCGGSREVGEVLGGWWKRTSKPGVDLHYKPFPKGGLLYVRL